MASENPPETGAVYGRCPICKEPTALPFRPFCSARCKGADLGAWATDQYRVEASEEPQPEDQSE
ncbi:MAG: DNA gyrase inhibitor YacG [Sulfuritalea sp.]|nr:DNA gyrase inhibitor YacG [Sulfuritalea sp.]